MEIEGEEKYSTDALCKKHSRDCKEDPQCFSCRVYLNGFDSKVTSELMISNQGLAWTIDDRYMNKTKQYHGNLKQQCNWQEHTHISIL